MDQRLLMNFGNDKHLVHMSALSVQIMRNIAEYDESITYVFKDSLLQLEITVKIDSSLIESIPGSKLRKDGGGGHDSVAHKIHIF
ncbi:hypothetical protein Tco_0484078 [Tanacetum coccineum]